MEKITSEFIVSEIRKKKGLSGISPEIIGGLLESYLSKNKISLSKITLRGVKLIVKDIRASLRSYTGRFQSSSADRKKLVEAGDITRLLKSHSSTQERMEFYPELREKIYSLGISSILDLGCGLNPLALARPGIHYFASDIREDELEIVRLFFHNHHISGETFVYDLKKMHGALPNADICLLLKVVDVIETKGHKLAEKIIKDVPCKYVLVSFPTKTLSGKPMNHPQRGWIERMLNRLNYPFDTILHKNEIFYLIKKF